MKTFFNNFASWASRQVAKAWFFSFCILLVILWAPSYFLFGNVDTWQLLINTTTTIVTFLLVALLQNDQQRFEDATNDKLNAIACGVGDLLEKEGLTEQAKELYNVMKIEEDIEA